MLAAWVTAEPLPAGSTLCQPRAWRERGETQTRMDRRRGCCACHPRDRGMGPRGECHGSPARTTLESQTQKGCSPLDSTHAVGIPGSPSSSPILALHPSKLTPYTGYFPGHRRGRWGGTAQPGTHSSVSSQHLPPHISYPDAFQIPSDSPRPPPRVPWDPLQVLEGTDSTVGALGSWGCIPNPKPPALTRPAPTHAVMLPNRSRAPEPPDGQQDTLIAQAGRMGSAGAGKQQRDARGRRSGCSRRVKERLLRALSGAS